jgi:hypothetical protein
VLPPLRIADRHLFLANLVQPAWKHFAELFIPAASGCKALAVGLAQRADQVLPRLRLNAPFLSRCLSCNPDCSIALSTKAEELKLSPGKSSVRAESWN